MENKRRGEREEGRENTLVPTLERGNENVYAHRPCFVLRPSSFVIILLSLAFTGFIASWLLAAEPIVKEHPQVESMTAAEMADWVEKMPRDKKAELLRKKESFDMLGPLEREKLRELQKAIQKDDDAAELTRIMHDYYEWWKSLPPYSRNELSSLSSPQARIERIEQLKQRNPSKTLSDQDIAVLREWMKQYVTTFEDRYQEYLKTLSPEKRKDWEDKPPEQRRRDVMHFIRQQWQRGGNKTPLPEDLAELRAKLSPDTRQLLEGKPSEEQWRTIKEWLQPLARRQFPDRMGRRPGSLVDENEIAKFFESLSDEERMQLLNRQPEDMQHELQRRVFLSRMKSMEPFLGRPEPPPSGPRGPHNPEWRPPNKSE